MTTEEHSEMWEILKKIEANIPLTFEEEKRMIVLLLKDYCSRGMP